MNKQDKVEFERLTKENTQLRQRVDELNAELEVLSKPIEDMSTTIDLLMEEFMSSVSKQAKILQTKLDVILKREYHE